MKDMMSTLGKRFERLLFFTAPITLAAFVVFISALGYNTYEDRVKASCYENGAKFINEKAEHFNELWTQAALQAKKDNSKIPYIDFEHDISIELIYGIKHGCWRALNDAKFDFQRPPTAITLELNKMAADLKKSPIKMYGVEIPEIATVGLAGTKIQVAMISLTQALQIALAPVFLLWLGSLYHTRLRELISLKKCDDIISVYPHVVNVFPLGHYPDLRRRNRLKQHAPALLATCFGLFRMTIVLCFVAPPTSLYLISLFYQPVFGSWWINLFAGFWVALYAVCTVLIEPTIGKKHFDGESPLR